MKSQEQREITLHPSQFRAYNFQKQFGACVCGVQSGKTFVGTVWAQKKITEYPQGFGLIAAPTVKILNQSTLEKFFQTFPQWRHYYKKQESCIDLPSGGKIFIRSTDDPLGLEGMTLNWGWLDEAGMMSRLVWVFIRARVSTTGGQVFFTSTPYSLNWLYQDIFIPWKEGTDPDIEFFTWRSVDNPFADKDYIDRERKRMTPEEFARRYEGEFTKMHGLVWYFPREQIIKQDDPLLLKNMKFCETWRGGVDWGFRPNPCGVLLAFVKDSVWYIVKEYKQEGKTTQDISEVCKQWERELNKKVIWYPDKAEPDRLEEFQRLNLRVGDANKDVPLGISHVQQLINEKRLYIVDSCVELLEEMEQYHFAEGKDGKPFKDAPVEVNDHLCDALRYMCMGYRPDANRTLIVREMQSRERNKIDLFR